MKLLLAGSIGLAVWIVALPAPAFAAEPSAGQQDYETRCANVPWPQRQWRRLAG